MAEGAKVGEAYVEITPDVDTSRFLSQGRAAGAAFAKQFDDHASKAFDDVHGRFHGLLNRYVSSGRDIGHGVARGIGSGIGDGADDIGHGFGRAWGHVAGLTSSAVDGIRNTWNRLWPGLHQGAENFGRLTTGAFQGISGVAHGAMSAIGSTVHTATSALHSMSAAATSTGYALQNVGSQAVYMGHALSMFVSLPIAGAGAALSAFGMKTAMDLENAQVALKALLPPGYDVEGLMKRLNKLAVSSPVFALDQITDFTRKLVGAGVEAGNAEKLLDSINKVFITYGVTGDKASKALLGVGQVFSKGKVQAEELTGQIGEQIPIWKLLSDATGMTIADLMAMSKAGIFTAQMFEDMLIKVGQLPAVMRGAEAGVTTLSAQLQVMKERFQTNLGAAFLANFAGIKAAVADFQPILERFTNWFVAQIPTMVGLLGQLMEKIQELAGWLQKLPPFVKDNALMWLGLAAAIGPLISLVGSLGSAFGGMMVAMGFLLNPWGLILGGIALGFGAVMLSMFGIEGTLDRIRDAARGFIDGFQARGGLDLIAGALTNIANAIRGPLGGALREFVNNAGINSFYDFGVWLGNKFADLIGIATNGVLKLIEMTTHLVDFIGPKVLAFKNTWDGLSETTKQNILLFGSLGLAILPMLPGLGQMLSAFGGMAGLLPLLVNGWTLLFVAGLAGVVATGAAMFALYQKNEELRRSIDGLIGGFKEAFKWGWIENVLPAWQALADTISTRVVPAFTMLAQSLGFADLRGFGEWLGGAFTTNLSFSLNMLNFYLTQISAAAAGLSLTIQAFRDVDKTMNELHKTAENGVVKFVEWSAAAGPNLIVALAPKWIELKNTFLEHFGDNGIGGYLKGFFAEEGPGGKFLSDMTTKWEALKLITIGTFSPIGAVDNVFNTVKGFGDMLKGLFGEGEQGKGPGAQMVADMDTKWGEAETHTQDSFGDKGEGSTNVWGTLKKWGSYLKGFFEPGGDGHAFAEQGPKTWDKMSSSFKKTFGEDVPQAASIAWQGLKNSWETELDKPLYEKITSFTSRVNEKWIDFLGGMVNISRDNWNQIAAIFEDTSNDRVNPALDTIREKLKETGKSFHDDFYKPADNWFMETGKSFRQNTLKPLQEDLKELWKSFKEDFLNPIGRGLSDTWDTVTKELKRQWGNFVSDFKNIVNDIVRAINNHIINPWNSATDWIPGARKIDKIPEWAQGGLVKGPGTGTSDSILARLSNGEFVVKAAAVQQFGSGFFDSLNRGVVPMMPVSQVPSARAVAMVGAGGPQETYVNVFLDGEPVRTMVRTEITANNYSQINSLRRGRRYG